MSFLLKRNNPYAWAGWYDTFNYPVGGLPYPWKDVGGGEASSINNLQEMVVEGDYAATSIHGPTFGFQPFTDSWGVELNYYWPVGGIAAQYCGFFIVRDWSYPQQFNTDAMSCRSIYSIANPTISLVCHDDAFGGGNTQVLINNAWSPVPDITFRLWVDGNKVCRVWCNDVYQGMVVIPDQYRPLTSRKGFRFFNNSLARAYIRWFFLYDRPSDLPFFRNWNSYFYDDFNRANGAVGNGWTRFNTNSGITSNSWGMNTGTDGQNMIVRDTGITDGKIRIEATVGGAHPPHNDRDSGLILCTNSSGNQGLAANVFGNKIFLSRFTGSPTSPSYTDFSSNTGIGVSTGDKVALSLYDGWLWMEINGDLKLQQANVHDFVPASNSWVGLRVERSSFANSNSWNDVRILITA